MVSNGAFEYRVTVHLDPGTRLATGVKPQGDALASLQEVLIGAIRVNMGRQYPRLVGCLDYDSPCPVAKQHRGRTIIPVDDTRQRFGADHERLLGATRNHVAVRIVEAINEAAAGSVHVDRWTALYRQLPLHNAGGRRDDLVRCARADNDQVNLGRVRFGHIERPARGFDRHGRSGLVVGCDMAALDPGALANPPVGRFHHALEVLVRQNLLREVAANTGDTCVSHQVPLFRSAAISRSVG
jgi:hypothetical protein